MLSSTSLSLSYTQYFVLPALPHTLVTTGLFPICVSVSFLLYSLVVFFFRFHIYMISYGICFPLTYFTQCKPFKSIYVAANHKIAFFLAETAALYSGGNRPQRAVQGPPALGAETQAVPQLVQYAQCQRPQKCIHVIKSEEKGKYVNTV